MENSLFWDAKQVNGAWDRTYNSDDFAGMFAGFWGDGLIPNAENALLVEPIENSFAIVVNPGDAFVKGRFYKNSEDKQFTLTSGNAQTRIDYIALRYDYSKRQVYLKVLEGAEGKGNPTFAQSDTLFDLLLAKITIPANAQYLTDEMVEDLRGTLNCPWVNLRFEMDAIVSSFESWYQDMRDLLDKEVAIELQNRITDLEENHAADVQALEQNLETLESQIQDVKDKWVNERQYDTVIKDGNIYIQPRPYDPEIDKDIP